MNKTLITFFTIIFCLTSSIGWSLDYKDLVERDGIYYKSFTDVPFTGEVTGKKQGLLKNGKEEGFWTEYYFSDQVFLENKGNYKNGKKEGSWVEYHITGQLNSKGNYNNGKKILLVDRNLPESNLFTSYFSYIINKKFKYDIFLLTSQSNNNQLNQTLH